MEKCEICGKRAAYNYQDMIVRYPIAKDGYLEQSEETDFDVGTEVNRLFCKKHAEQYETGEIE